MLPRVASLPQYYSEIRHIDQQEALLNACTANANATTEREKANTPGELSDLTMFVKRFQLEEIMQFFYLRFQTMLYLIADGPIPVFQSHHRRSVAVLLHCLIAFASCDKSALCSQELTASQMADLRSCKIVDMGKKHISANFLKSLMDGTGVETGQPLTTIYLKNIVVDGDLVLPNEEVKPDVDFTEATFTGDIDCAGCTFDSGFSIHGGTVCAAHFNNASAQRNLTFDNVTFSGGVYFDNLTVAGTLYMKGCMFKAKPISIGSTHYVPASFTDVHALNIDFSTDTPSQTIFMCPVNFDGAHLDGYASFANVQFECSRQLADFRNMAIQAYADFTKCTFEGPVSFQSSSIDSNLNIANSYFKNGGSVSDFEEMHVAGTANFEGATFSGPVSFSRCVIRGDLDFQNATIMKANASTEFVSDWDISLCPLSQTPKQNSDFYESNIEDADFATTTFFGPIDFSEATFHKLNLGDAGHFHSTADFEGATYTSLLRNGQATLLSLFRKLPEYDLSDFTTLENYLQGKGDADGATKVLFAQKSAEMNSLMVAHSRSVVEAIENRLHIALDCFLEVTVGYGRLPGLALIWSLGFVLYGAYLYRDRNKMKARKPEDELRRDYNGFVYSLSLFLPFVDLDSSTIWRPDTKPRQLEAKWRTNWRVAYMRLHILLGWLLVPIGLASITGLIK